MKENVKIFALGGLDENGKSLYVVTYNEQLYIFDAGLRYPEEALLGIDVILPGVNYLLERKDCIRGIFLTHGHDENMGALPFIIEELGGVDIYCTNITYLALSLTAKRFKKDITQANIHIIDKNETFIVNGMTIHAFGVTHNIPNACGFALETDHGQIIYPGDYILDFNEKPPYDTSLTRIMELAKKPTLAFLGESYNASYQGYVAPNNHLSTKLNSILDDVKGRVFISIYGQTPFLLQEIIECAREKRRKIFLYTDQVKETVEVYKDVIPKFKDIDSVLTNNAYERDCVVVVCELGQKVFEILDQIAALNDTGKTLKITGDDAIVIASPAHTGTERSFARILDDLYRTNAQIFNISKDFTTMHAGSEDIKTMLSIFKPKYFIPVRGYYIKLIENAKSAMQLGYNHSNILVYDNGMIATFIDGELQRNYESIPSEELMVDGIGIGDVGNVVINDRRKLQADGVLILGISFSMSTRKIAAGPEIQMRGFYHNKNNQTFEEKIGKCFQDTVYEFVQKPGLVDFNELRNICKEKVGALVKAEIDREPMILPVIISV